MKVETKKSFEPVVITLESQREVDALQALLGKVKGNTSGGPCKFLSLFYNRLISYAGVDCDQLITDDLYAKSEWPK